MPTPTRALTVSLLCFLLPACGALKGAGIGGVVAGTAAALMGKDRKSILIAAGIGSAVGGFIGHQVAKAEEGRLADEEEKLRAAEKAESLRREEAGRVEAARRFEETRLAKAQEDVEKRREEELERVAEETKDGKTPVPVAPIPDAIPLPVAIIVEIPNVAESGARQGIIVSAETGEPLSDKVVVIADDNDSEIDEDEPFVLTIPGATNEETRNYTAIYAG